MMRRELSDSRQQQNRTCSPFILCSLTFLAASTVVASGQSADNQRQAITQQQMKIPPARRNTDSLQHAPLSFALKKPPALDSVDPAVFSHGPRDRKAVALTFDACSTHKPSHYDERITKILIETKTPATLFLGGKWMEEESEQTKYLASITHFELANHTFLHLHLKEVSDQRIRQELLWTQEVMYSLTGKQPTLFRAPYGEYDDRVVRIASSLGLRTIQFDLASGDPDSNITKEKLIEYVTSMARNGSIIVLHINRRGWHTAEALPEIIARLRKRGFTFMTVSEMLSLHTEEKMKRAKE